jgi:hypothetical protein
MTAALHGESDWQTERMAQVLELAAHTSRLARHGGGRRDRCAFR